MLERELEIFVHGPGGIRRLFIYRRWMFLAPLLALLVLASAGAWLWRFQSGHDALAVRRQAALGRLTAQKAAAMRLRERMRALAEEAGRLAAFNAKLGIMLDRPAADPGAMGDTPVPRLPGAAMGDALGRRLFDFLDALGGRMALEETVQQELARSLVDRKLEFLAKPSLWPARGYITSAFGPRPSPFGRGGDFHNGVDIKVPIGSPVYAAGAGRVVETGSVSGYGLTVVVAHDYGLETVYAHLKKIEVKPGQEVKRGQVIALSGNTGRTTGSHLHYEVRAGGTPVNPRQYLLD
jgi:murein DD-endopeptidase MepM/ murein hydrolase activator NlpD